MVTTIKFSQFADANLNTSTNLLVGVSSPSGGINIKTPQFATWTTATRPSAPYAGIFGYNSSLIDIEFFNGATWVQLGAGSVGTVTQINTGTGLTGGPITTIGTISFATIAANSLWANNTAGVAVPTVIPISTFLRSANNLSDVVSVASARSNLGLAIGVNVEAWSAILDQIAGGIWTGATSITTLGTIAFGTWQSVAIGPIYGGTGLTSYVLGDTLYASGANVLAKLSGNTTATKQFLSQTGTGVVSAAPVWATITGTDITGAALSRVDDTNVTLTLGGSPTTALLRAASLTLGWSGQLSVARGGSGLATLTAHNLLIGNDTTALTLLPPSATTGIPLISQGAAADPTYGTAVVAGGGTGATSFTAYAVLCAGTTSTGAFQNVSGVGTANQVLVSNGAGLLPTWQSVPGVVPAALTRIDDTNVTLTLGGTPATALLQATSLTLGWNGQLSLARGGTNANLTAANGAIPYSTATAIALLAAGSSGQLFQSGGAGAPNWTTATYPTTAGTTGNVLRSDGTNFVSAADAPGALTTNHIFVGSAGGIATDVAMSGDATIVASGALTIANSAITNAKVAAAAAIDFSKLATLTSGNLLVGSAGNVATSVAMSGDATLIASGALTIANNAVTNAKAAQMATLTIKGNNTGGTANALDLTVAQVNTMLGGVSNGFNVIGTQTITATGAFTYTPTTGTKYAIFELQAGGGGSGGSTGAGGQAAVGGSGGGGGYYRLLVTGSANLAAITGSVGVGGAAGASGNNNGGAGGNTTLVINAGTTWTATGGSPGNGQASSAATQLGATPGNGGVNSAGTNATLIANIPGQSGLYGFSLAAGALAIASQGGASQLGNGGSLNGVAGFVYGGGASGNGNNGGANTVGLIGAQGIVIVTEFISS